MAKEAEKRGLKNLRTTPEALRVELEKKNMQVFVENEVYNEREIKARNEIKLEKYINLVAIESRVLADLSRNHILPTAVRYQNQLLENVRGMKEIFGEEYKEYAKDQLDLIKEISGHHTVIKDLVSQLREIRAEAKLMKTAQERADHFCFQLIPKLEEIRLHVDALEMRIDDEMWPLPKYRELLFMR